MTKQKMIHSLEFKNGKTIDNGCVPMTKREIKCFESFEKRNREGKEIYTTYEPNDLWLKLSVDVKKDKRGNITVSIKQAKKGYCHKWDCPKKAKKKYVLCPKHLNLNKSKK